MMDWSYIAAFFDGEGWFSFGERDGGFVCEIGCCQSTPQAHVLDVMECFLEAEGITCSIFRGKHNGPRRHPISRLIINGKRDNKDLFISKVSTFLIVKRDKALALRDKLRSVEIRHTAFYPDLKDARATAAWNDYSLGLSFKDACKKHGISGGTMSAHGEAVGLHRRTRSEAIGLAWAFGRRHGKPLTVKIKHCKRGHEFVEGSYTLNSQGGRICLPCRRERDRK